jgi:hypothetical protein
VRPRGLAALTRSRRCDAIDPSRAEANRCQLRAEVASLREAMAEASDDPSTVQAIGVNLAERCRHRAYTSQNASLGNPLDERSLHDALFQVLMKNDVESWGERYLIALTRSVPVGNQIRTY